MLEQKLPVGIQSFQDIRMNGYVYVDKTEYIWKLVNRKKSYFLSRPRRFGKSLLVSAMEAYFQGRKDLFHGMAIEEYENAREDQAWLPYPVITFYLAGGDYNAPDGLKQRLNQILSRYERDNHIKADAGMDLPNRFANLIEQLYTRFGRQVVVLVDEYDKPLVETMTINPQQEEINRLIYKSFFSVLKDEDQYLRFIFFTGVTRFSKVSVFSDLNQLDDISLDDDFACICGITQEEIGHFLAPDIENFAARQKITPKECMEKLAGMYDGYHFSASGEGVYNPFSLLQALSKKRFGSYWFSTGTPTFLINKLKHSAFTAEQFSDGVKATEASLTDYQENNPDPIPLFYQAGYLTICGWNERFNVYMLRFPNAEVRYGFLNSLADAAMPAQENRSGFFVMNFVEDLECGDLNKFMNRVTAVFASIPYTETAQKNYEAEWRNEIYLLLALLGMNTYCEVHTSRGRADCVIETERYVYILEFKLDKTAQDALDQIEEKGYAESYKADSRKICKVGVNFSSEKRNIDSWKVITAG